MPTKMACMADTAARTMRLLSLLQRRRYWPGPELAGRLEVSERTLRRDIERLRMLGYSVVSDRGVDGGYQLESAAGLAPLLVDDDEAVALAVGLNLAGQVSADLAEAATGALAKVLALLPPEQRRRAETLRAATASGPGGRPGGPALDVLATVAGACRDRVRLRFEYCAADGTESERYVEPYGLVAFGPRYYVVAWDPDRDDWRTFRLDRMTVPRPSRNPFVPRPLPADDLHAYVRQRQRDVPAAHRVIVDIERPGDDLRATYGRWVDVSDLEPGRCRVTIDADDFTWPLHILANVDAPFELIEPGALAERLHSVAGRFADAAAQVRADGRA
jgi:predicted DNA-binding transcriptional regulator YafY